MFMDDPNQPIEGAFLQALESGPVKNLVNPVTKHLGETLGYIGDIVRFYSHQNLAKIFTKWAEAERGGKSLDEQEFKRVMPLLPLAAQVSDDELQDRWAALLESAARGDEGFLPSFGQTLSHLTAEEAKFAKRLHTKACDGVSSRYFDPGLHPLGEENAIIKLYDPSIKTSYQVWDRPEIEEKKANYEKLAKALLIVQDLERLGILEGKSEPESYWELPDSIGDYRLEPRVAGNRIPLESRIEYRFTQYGLSFLRAVSPKKPGSKD
jgi:hypothetical protein